MGCRLIRTVQIFLFLSAVPTTCRGQPSSEDCPDTYAAFNECVGWSGEEGFSECENCYLDYIVSVNSIDVANNESLTSCTQVDDESCAALAGSCAAPCTKCYQELLTYFACEWGCTLDDACAASDENDNDTPAPTSAPTALKCPDEQAAFNECVEQSGAEVDCSTCKDELVPDDGIDSCEYSEQLTCSLVEECPICGDCQEEYTTFVNCLNKGSCLPFNCTSLSPTIPPSPSPTTDSPTLFIDEKPTAPPNGTLPDDDDNNLAACASQRDELDDCMFDNLPAAQSGSCQSCVEAKFDQHLGQGTASTTKCVTIDTELCDAVSKTCECGACSGLYTKFLQCRLDQGSSGCRVCASLPTSAASRFGSPWGAGPWFAIPTTVLLLRVVAL
jgi:hypothetical protein